MPRGGLGLPRMPSASGVHISTNGHRVSGLGSRIAGLVSKGPGYEDGKTSPRYHVLRDCRLGDVEAELQKLAVDMRRTPERVLKAHSSDKVAHLFVDLRSATERAGFPSPEHTEGDLE